MTIGYYVCVFVFYGIALAALTRENTQHQLAIFIVGLFPIFLLVTLRGDVGTDTAVYLQIISEIEKNISSNLELGFVLLIKSMLWLSMTPRMILAIIAFVITGLLVYAASFSRRALLLTAFCIVPLFYLDMTMNGLRYGLAFASMMCAVGLFYQKRVRLCILFAMCGVSFHLSGWLLIAMMALFAHDKDEFKKWLIITFGLGLLILTMQNMDAIVSLFGRSGWSGVSLESKAIAYANFPSPSLLSGLAPLTLSLITLGMIKKADMADHAIGNRRVYFLLLGIIATFVIAKFSYAGLRLQFVMLFFMLVYLQYKPTFKLIDIAGQDKKGKRVLIAMSLLGMAVFFKNALVTEGIGPSPWLPYSIEAGLLATNNMADTFESAR